MCVFTDHADLKSATWRGSDLKDSTTGKSVPRPHNASQGGCRESRPTMRPLLRFMECVCLCSDQARRVCWIEACKLCGVAIPHVAGLLALLMRDSLVLAPVQIAQRPDQRWKRFGTTGASCASPSFGEAGAQSPSYPESKAVV